ncbi:MAG TPA: SDR family oxidoreductase [Thermoanaerobaculia bacterium]|nr:SDR family oxidoreductase [Thermoanaerobaculia bacterium]
MQNDTFIVTGGGSGSGLAIARSLAERGARVEVWGRSAAKLEAAVACGCAADLQTVDLAQADQVNEAFQSFDRKHRRLSGFVHSAGIWTPGPLTEVPPDVVVSHIAAVVTAAALCLRGAARRLLEHGGPMVLIAAASAKAGFTDTALNTLAKRSNDGLHEGLLRELRGSGVKLTTIYPDSMSGPDSPSIAQGKAMRYDDVAEAVLFALTAAPTVHVQEIVLTAPGTGR